MANVKVKIQLENGAKAPERAHKTDAGADLFAYHDAFLPKGSFCNVRTGVHIEIPNGFFGLLQSKSGLNSKSGITCRGVIDEGYSGEIVATLQNLGEDYYVNKGDKITQLILIPCLYADFVEVDEISSGDRGGEGFGSTGKN